MAHSHQILIVEDNEDLADMLSQILALVGYEVRLAPTAERGLALAREARPDIIFSDIGLPGMTGLELAQAVRSDIALSAVPLVALTGFGNERDHDRLRAAGFNAHLVKPVTLEDIEGVMIGLLSQA